MLKLWDAGQENTWLASFRVRTPFVPWYDEIDSFGHVSNIVYPRYFEFGRMQYFKTVKDPEPDTGVVFPFAHVIAEQHIRYIDRCFFDEQLTVLSKITELGRSSASFEQAIIGADGKMRAIATTVVVHHSSHESKQWTTSQREAIAAFEGFQSSSVREF
jgi:YbgC/YbaW family acyl-CoA thioester hydrolase